MKIKRVNKIKGYELGINDLGCLYEYCHTLLGDVRIVQLVDGDLYWLVYYKKKD